MLKQAGEPGHSMVELLITIGVIGLVASAVAGVYQVSQQTYIRASSLEAVQTGARAGLDRMAGELRLIGSFWIGASCVESNCNAITTASSNSITFRANVENVDGLSASNGAEVSISGTAGGTTVPLSISATATADAFKVYENQGLNDFVYIADGGRREVRRIESRDGSTLNLVSALSSLYPVPPDTNVQNVLVRDVKTITYALEANPQKPGCVPFCLTRSQGGSGNEPVVDNVSNLTFTFFGTNGLTPTTDPALIREIQIDLTVRGGDGSLRRMITRVRPRNLP